jgi:hypothetical protein
MFFDEPASKIAFGFGNVVFCAWFSPDYASRHLKKEAMVSKTDVRLLKIKLPSYEAVFLEHAVTLKS